MNPDGSQDVAFVKINSKGDILEARFPATYISPGGPPSEILTMNTTAAVLTDRERAFSEAAERLAQRLWFMLEGWKFLTAVSLWDHGMSDKQKEKYRDAVYGLIRDDSKDLRTALDSYP